MGFLAPAGTVIHFGEIFAGYARAYAGEDPRKTLADDIRERVGSDAWPVCSGRGAMTLLLRAVRAARPEPLRDEVVIPAYTCYSVAASVARAGLRPRLCDVDPTTLGMDPRALERVDFSRVLAVVSANLYGIPNDLSAIEEIARHHGVFMIDDAAQSLGARIGSRSVGTFGDAGLYSFDKGKIICTIQGGAIVARTGPVRRELGKLLDALEPSPLTERLQCVLKLPVYVACLRPSVFGVVRRLPFLGLGRTEYEERFPVSQLGRMQAGMAIELLGRLDAMNAARRRKAEGIRSALAEVAQVKIPRIADDAVPVFARCPIRVDDTRTRDHLIAALEAAGIGATGSYPLALGDVPEIREQLRNSDAPIPGARQVAKSIITLPTHAHCPEDLGTRIRDCIVGNLDRVPHA